jgi:hypothetical protein
MATGKFRAHAHNKNHRSDEKHQAKHCLGFGKEK